MFANHEDDNEQIGLRDRLQLWCDENQHYALGQRLALVPEDVLKKIDRKPLEKVLLILEKEGY